MVALPVIKVGFNINLGISEFEPDKLNYSLATVVALPVIKVGLNINLGNSEFKPDKLNYSLAV